MIAAVARRAAMSLVTLLLLAAFIFVATEILPGDALDVSLTAEALLCEACDIFVSDFTA